LSISVEDFINQFENKDKNLIRIFLNRILFIDNKSFEKFITDEIVKNYCKKPKTAIFTVKNLKKKENYDNSGTDLDREENYDSSDKIGYMLENIHRQHGRFFYINPSINTMKAEKISRVLLVEDNISSGTKVKRFLNENKDFRTIKSWVSYKKCTIDILTYALYEKGKKFINKHCKKINSYKSKIYIPENNKIFTKEFIKLFEKYGNKIMLPSYSLGYDETKGFVVFEHGCPNSLPVVFWRPKKKVSWESLFPNRGVDISVSDIFKKRPNQISDIDKIADTGKCRVAINILEQIENYRISPENMEYLLVLIHLDKGIKHKNLSKYIFFDDLKIGRLLDKLKEWEYIDIWFKLTDEGRYLIERYSKAKVKFKPREMEQVSFFPKIFKGVPRNV
jgi:hypothetical protein